MRAKKGTNKILRLIETISRKGKNFCSMVYTSTLIKHDGLDWRDWEYHERLHYLEFRSVLNFKPGIVVYDIGANTGELASFFAKFPCVSKIYCFEPVPQVFSQLVQNTQNVGKIRCLPIALGMQSGLQKMHTFDFSPYSSLLPMGSIHKEEFLFADHSWELEVQTDTLEGAVQKYELSPPDFIKIDVQGFEDRVVRGGENILKKAAFCLIELSLIRLYRESALITDINPLMRNLGFRLVDIMGKIKGKSGEILQIDGLYRNDRFSQGFRDREHEAFFTQAKRIMEESRSAR